MKYVLITGANSYIGTSVERYLEQWPDKYQITTISMLGDEWEREDFSIYDTVFHVAGIAHADTGNVSEERKSLYYQVNTDLTIKTAKKAKQEGVKQFVFMSSSIVYGESAPIGEKKIITVETPVSPQNFYGDSKVKAEKGILSLQDEKFNVVVLRPPMIYGKGCKGNYPVLSKIARALPVFPIVDNQRSMLYIENLCEFVRLMIDNKEHGIFLPQNSEYSNTSMLVKMIAELNNKRIIMLPGFTGLLKIMSHFSKMINKAFGSLCYDLRASEYKENYRIFDLRESVKNTEK